MKVKVIVECGTDGKYSAFMDCYDYDFSLAGFGNTAKDAVNDFYACVLSQGKHIKNFDFYQQF